MMNLAKSAAALGLVAVAATALLAGVDHLTEDRIAEQERKVLLRQLGQILPEAYDNAVLDDHFTFRDEAHFPNG